MATVGLVKRPGAWYERGGVGLGTMLVEEMERRDCLQPL